MRHRDQPAEWQAIATGWRLERYVITNRGPGRWALEVDGTVRSEHRRASDAAARAQLEERSRRRRLLVARNLAVIAAGAVALMIAQPWRLVPNEAYEPARHAVLALEAAHRSVATGERTATSFTGNAGITGGEFDAQLPFDLGGSATAPVRSYQALVTVHDGDCYVIRWPAEETPRRYSVLTGVLEPGLACEVHPRLAQSGLFSRVSSQRLDAAVYEWNEVLPRQTHQTVWFVPVVIASVFVMLQGVIGISLAFLRPARHRIPALVAASTADRLRASRAARSDA